jgi:hypothetical protein
MCVGRVLAGLGCSARGSEVALRIFVELRTATGGAKPKLLAFVLGAME